MTNNQQLAAHCRDVIANPQGHQDWVVDMARVALASVEADPRGWLTWHAIPPTWSEPGGGGEYLAFHESKPERSNDDGTDSWPVYDAPPVAVMEPVVLPYKVHFGHQWVDMMKVVEAIHAAGGSVKE